jgi:hypothetical protein
MRALPHHIISAALCVLHLQGVWSVAQSGEQGGVERSVAFKEDVKHFFLISFGQLKCTVNSFENIIDPISI